MKSLLIFSAIFFLLPFYNPAQEVAPMQVGNTWLYETDAFVERFEIVDSAVIVDSLEYFEISSNYGKEETRYLRLRSDNSYVIKEDSTFPGQNNEKIFYKKNAVLGQSWQVVIPGIFDTVIYTITDTFFINVFGTQVIGKTLNEDFGFSNWDYIWTEKFGKISKKNQQGEVTYSLRACVINGVVYGDTNFAALSVNTSEPFSVYKLYSNYPNPFNPSTKIKYQIPELSFVTLKVYNNIGEEIKTLVNELQPVGIYSVEFNAKDLPSGVYFYTITAGKFRETKKMIILK